MIRFQKNTYLKVLKVLILQNSKYSKLIRIRASKILEPEPDPNYFNFGSTTQIFQLFWLFEGPPPPQNSSKKLALWKLDDLRSNTGFQPKKNFLEGGGWQNLLYGTWLIWGQTLIRYLSLSCRAGRSCMTTRSASAFTESPVNWYLMWYIRSQTETAQLSGKSFKKCQFIKGRCQINFKKNSV